MIYIPDEWIKDKTNEEKVRDLLSKSSGCLRLSDKNEDTIVEDIEKKLKELGENKILEEFRKGTFAL